jgi:uncharacterized protein
MMRSYTIGALAVCLTIGATGCSRSPRVTFYTLESAARLEAARPAAASLTAAPAAAGSTTAGSASIGLAAVGSTTAGSPATAAGSAAALPVIKKVSVGPITLPELVDRPQLVVRVADNRVDILEMQRWAEPLKSEIPRVIAEDLGRLLGTDRVASYQQHAAAHADCRVLLDIQRFEAVSGEAVSVEARWSLHRGAGVAPLTGRSVVREPTKGDGYDALIAAYGRALLAVSVDLARAIGGDTAVGR